MSKVGAVVNRSARDGCKVVNRLGLMDWILRYIKHTLLNTMICPISGRFCQEDINECVLSNPCYNGATCRNTEGSYICDCVHGYDGVRCANNVDECVPGMG